MNRQNTDPNRPSAGRGRPPATSRGAIATTALELFEAHGYEATTMEDIAAAVGVSRKTLFNYFPTKSDIVWSDYERELGDLQRHLDDASPDVPTLTAVGDSIIHSLRLSVGQPRAVSRTQARLIDAIPALHGYAATRGQRWADTIANFIATREHLEPDSLAPRLLGRCYWTAMFAGFAHWADSHDENPEIHIRAAFDLIARIDPKTVS